MKKLQQICIVFMILSLLCSCSENRKIKSVKIDDITYETIYLYSFTNAQIDGFHPMLQNDKTLISTNGYVFLTEKYEKGDVVEVWENLFFDDNITTSTSVSYHRGTTAVIDELLESYQIEIENKQNTFIITCYLQNSRNTYSIYEYEDIEKPQKVTMEVVKERVMIYYE